MPPAATMVSPVMYLESSEAKNATIPDMSSGWPNLKFYLLVLYKNIIN